MTQTGDPTPYELRVAGLDRRLTEREWSRVLTQMCKRRGYRSMRISETEDDEAGAVKQAIAENESLMREKGYRTVGEMLLKDEKFAESKRNRGDYRGVVSRELLLDEIHKLFEAQRNHGSPFASPDFEESYIETLSMQAPITEGDALAARVGLCSLDRTNPRIPLACPTFERFRILDKLHNIRYTLEPGGARHTLTQDQMTAVSNEAFRATALSLTHVRKLCGLPDEARFVGVRYDPRSPADTSVESKEKLPHPKKWNQMRKAVSDVSPDAWENLAADFELLDSIATVLTYYKYPESVARELEALGLEAPVRDALGDLRFSGHAHLSRNTLLAILPYMEAGQSYSEACASAGFDHSAPMQVKRQDKLPPIPPDEIRNPVVLRALSQTRKVVNAIIDTWGPIEELHVELGREVAQAHEDRQKIEKSQKENQARNESVKESICQELQVSDPRGHDIIKYKLWTEQDGRCAYSGKPLDPTRVLREPGYAEVDHILPHGRSFDDSYMNKVLVSATENQRKRHRTPYEYMGGDPERWHHFEELVASMHLPRPKRDRLLRKEFDERAAEEFRERNLNDTRYIARYFKNYVESHLRFASDKKRPVICVNGRATAYLRKAWQLHKVREDGDLHHALDAAVVAVTSPGIVQSISRFFSVRPLRNPNGVYVDTSTGEIIDAKHVPEPWEGFADELRTVLETPLPPDPLELLRDPARGPAPILVSRMPTRSIQGQAHEETIRRIEGTDEAGRITTSKRVRLEEITLPILDRMVGKNQDRELYLALKARLEAHGGKAAAAFAEPFYKPTKAGRTAPRVRGIRVHVNPTSGGTEIRGGLARNGKMVRTDVFEKDGRYYLVPVYLKDVAAGILPNRAIIQGKAEKDWREIDDTYRFVFSLYSNDLVRLVKKRGEVADTWFGYFVGTSRSTGSITIRAHDRTWERPSIGVAQGVMTFEKLDVDVLGRSVYRIHRERRRGFPNGRDRE